MNSRYSLLLWLVIVTAFTLGATFAGSTAAPRVDASSVIGTWKGESTCVDPERPACKNEVVVYRFEAVPNKPNSFMLFADKIIDGKRQPMGAHEFVYDSKKGTLSSEFTRRQTHGLFEFQLNGDEIEGTLIILPAKTVARRIKVKRVKADEVPEAPARDLYSS